MVTLVKHVHSAALIAACLRTSLAGCKSNLEARFAGEKVTMEQVPDPVKQVIAQQSLGGKVSEIKKKAKDGKTLYYASLSGGAEERRLVIDQDGKVIRAESESGEDDDD